MEVYNEIASSEQAVYKNALDNALAKASTLDAELAHQQRRSEDLAEFARVRRLVACGGGGMIGVQPVCWWL